MLKCAGNVQTRILLRVFVVCGQILNKDATYRPPACLAILVCPDFVRLVFVNDINCAIVDCQRNAKVVSSNPV
jgi:hypothetical protein